MQNKLRIYLAWAVFLLNRSRYVLTHQGLPAFFHKLSLYLGGAIRRKIARILRINSSSPIPFLKPRKISSDNPLVSFVIPIYDRTDVLKTAIDSALNQTIKGIEVILVTDGSPVETLAVVNSYSGDRRVKIFHYPNSSGNAVRGRNKGILEASGEYIAFLDSDDIALPDRVERSLKTINDTQADVVYGAWSALMDGSRKVDGIVDGQVIYSPDCDFEMLKHACVPCQSTTMVRRELFFQAGFLKPNMRYREDHELWLRLSYLGAKFKSIPEQLVKLRLHQGNNELNFKQDDSHWESMLHEEYTKLGPIPKKIAFILPGVGISGGIAVVLKHAAMLLAKGHDAFVINTGEKGDAGWFSNNPVPIISIADERLYHFDNIDLIIATGWRTVEWLKHFNAKRKLYFVQSDERRFYDNPALKKQIEDTYRTDCEYLSEAHWIIELLRNEFSHECHYVPNGLDQSIFFPDTPLQPKNPLRPRVLIEGPIIIPFKGLRDAYLALESLDCEIWIVSSAGKPEDGWRCDRFFEKVPFSDMRRIYSSCDIFLKMSRVEGFFGPPMEAMACGCAVVVGKVTGWDEYIIDNGNALVVEQGDIVAANSAVERLIQDTTLRSRLVAEGFSTVKKWTWERSSDAMMELVSRENTEKLEYTN